jgi:hypothetical protein
MSGSRGWPSRPRGSGAAHPSRRRWRSARPGSSPRRPRAPFHSGRRGFAALGYLGLPIERERDSLGIVDGERLHRDLLWWPINYLSSTAGSAVRTDTKQVRADCCSRQPPQRPPRPAPGRRAGDHARAHQPEARDRTSACSALKGRRRQLQVPARRVASLTQGATSSWPVKAPRAGRLWNTIAFDLWMWTVTGMLC